MDWYRVGSPGGTTGARSCILLSANRSSGTVAQVSGGVMEPDYKNRSQTAFAVSIICLCFVAETMNFARGNPEPAAIVVLALLAVVGVGSVVAGIVYHRRARQQRGQM